MRPHWFSHFPGLSFSRLVLLSASALSVTFATGLITITPANAGAPGPFLVKGINPGPTGSNLEYLYGHRGTLYFSARTEPYGQEPWISDGTDAGTKLLKDIRPGPEGSFPWLFEATDDYLYFTADDGAVGRVLWRTDGTAAGTVRLQDVVEGAEGRSITPFAQVRDTHYYVSDGEAHGNELWKTEGANGKLVLVKDINPGEPSSSPSFPTLLGGLLYFEAASETSGRELWQSDGSEKGTRLVKDINPGEEDGVYYFFDLYCFQNSLYFSADNGVNGLELWKSDGTSEGTALVKDIYPGATGAEIQWMAASEDSLYFQADHPDFGSELWKSDGTAAGIELVKDIVPGPGHSYSYILQPPMEFVGETLYFSAYKSSEDLTSIRWQSDGTELGTMPIDVPGFGTVDGITGVDSAGALLFFIGEEADQLRLVRSDLTEDGTTEFEPAFDLNTNGFVRWIQHTGEYLFFAATPSGAANDELWAYHSVPATSPVSQCKTERRYVPIVQSDN